MFKAITIICLKFICFWLIVFGLTWFYDLFDKSPIFIFFVILLLSWSKDKFMSDLNLLKENNLNNKVLLDKYSEKIHEIDISIQEMKLDIDYLKNIENCRIELLSDRLRNIEKEIEIVKKMSG